MPVIKKRRNDESGAFAVAYAILVVLLISFAALGTDLGNGISRKTSVQSQADFAAYDAGQLLNTSVRTGMTIPTAVVNQVRDSLNNNQPQTDNTTCETTTPVTCVTSSMLTDGNLYNGEVRVTSLGLQVIAPSAHVDFGFGNAIGVNGTNVIAKATVNVFSPGKAVFPMFAINGCDWGRQTLTDPSGNSQATPTLAYANEQGGAELITPLETFDASNASVISVPVNAANYQVKISTSNWDKTWKIGFFKPDGSEPAATMILSGSALRDGATHTSFPSTAPVTNPLQKIEVTIPSSVASVEGVWYIRAYGGGNSINAGGNKWSRVDTAVPLRIGQAVLECGAVSDGGNFGTLRLPRTDYPTSNDIALNIAKGFQSPLNLVVHEWGRTQDATNPSWDGKCVNGQQNAVVSSGSTLKDDTNCVDTDPGVPANAATAGFVTGVKQGNTVLADGLLHKDTACDRNGGTAERTVLGVAINDDVLTCFLTGSHTLGQIADENYSGGPALTSDVLKSPRFGFVPVVSKSPSQGSSATFSIIDFRPAFITDEVPGSTAVKGSKTGTADNGIIVQNNDVKQIKVVFFAFDALPRDGDIPLMEYLGVGKPIVHLVD